MNMNMEDTLWVHGRADDINRAEVPGYHHVMIVFSPSVSLMDPPGTIAELAQWSQNILCVSYSPVWNLFSKQVLSWVHVLLSLVDWAEVIQHTGID
jgi:hypothetical protein